ncbi:YdeI/OmpD-associated family protein [Pseudomonas rossensis]|uniref:YdeI/OmpD-associated family protein n=1 Tax=Pseudomonas rossensis TaxID=2305471 RepID=UPI0032613A16
MTTIDVKSRFEAKLLRPAKPGNDTSWAFLVLPGDASEQLPRRGRTTVEGTINAHHFQATLEPDDWLRVSRELLEAAGAAVGDIVTLELASVKKDPEPDIPADFQEALAATPEARKVWNNTTTIARVDWIHWITSAKQLKTRAKRCFDQSGYYSKAFRAPEADNS